MEVPVLWLLRPGPPAELEATGYGKQDADRYHHEVKLRSAAALTL